MIDRCHRSISPAKSSEIGTMQLWKRQQKQVDVWAAGVLAYELTVGRPPFEVNDEQRTASLIMYSNDLVYPARYSALWADFVKQVGALAELSSICWSFGCMAPCKGPLMARQCHPDLRAMPEVQEPSGHLVRRCRRIQHTGRLQPGCWSTPGCVSTCRRGPVSSFFCHHLIHGSLSLLKHPDGRKLA